MPGSLGLSRRATSARTSIVPIRVRGPVDDVERDLGALASDVRRRTPEKTVASGISLVAQSRRDRIAIGVQLGLSHALADSDDAGRGAPRRGRGPSRDR